MKTPSAATYSSGMIANCRKWLRDQLKALQAPIDPDEPFYEGLRSIVSEAGRRAAEAGLPEAVAACATVLGGPFRARGRSR